MNELEKLEPNTNSVIAKLELPNKQELESLSEMKEGYDLTVTYRTQEKWAELQDQEQRVFFLGTKQVPNDEGEMITCAVFAGEKGAFMSAQMLLLNSVETLQSGTPLKITYKGKKKNKSNQGSTNVFDVVTLVRN